MRSILLAGVLVSFSTLAMAQSTDSTAFKNTQSPEEWRVANYMGQPIVNSTGEKIGDVNDLLFDRSGKITTVVIGVGGFLGLGEKRVALPFTAVTYTENAGQRQIMVPLTKEALQSAPDYVLTEKTTFDKVKERAGEVANKASEKAGEIKDQAVKKIEEYRKEEPAAETPKQP
jgi:sporulation protein YlmC with PRC-barrel domain